MKEEIIKRLESMRRAIKEAGIDAVIVPSFDRHLNEYTPHCWQARQYISGFLGSAGTAVVTAEHAALWTDSRYFLEATEVLRGTTYELMKEGMPGTPTIAAWLRSLPEVKRVALNGECMSVADAAQLQKELRLGRIELDLSHDFIKQIRGEEMPDIPLNDFFVQPDEDAGRTPREKVEEVRRMMREENADTLIVTMMDEVCWLYNVRSSDVEYNPTGVAYAMVTAEGAFFYVDDRKMTNEVRCHLEKNGVEIRPYDRIYEDVSALPETAIVWVDPIRTNAELGRRVPKGCIVVDQMSPITILKSIKTEAEYQGCRRAMLRDGVALTKFWKHFYEMLDRGETPTEYEIDAILAGFRAESDRYLYDSFTTITGYNANGAIVHYHPMPDTSAKIKPQGSLLLDSGAQYYDGTTDITRTVSLDGKPSEKLRHDYTLVLKGHIDLQMAVFPKGTRGNQLDVLAHRYLWQEHKNYGHGTGHGVGHFLCCHEGPQNFRTDNNPSPIRLHSVTSDEPGYYPEGEYGIRIENLLRCIKVGEGGGEEFYGFECLTLCWLDNRMVDPSMLDDAQLRWYNDYQERVYREISPELDEETAKWLRDHTLPLER